MLKQDSLVILKKKRFIQKTKPIGSKNREHLSCFVGIDLCGREMDG